MELPELPGMWVMAVIQ